MDSSERYLLWDFDNTLAYRRSGWTQCLVEIAAEAQPHISYQLEQFIPHLASGFPWHTPEREHPELSNPDDWWLNLAPLFEQAFVLGGSIEAPIAASLATQVRARYVNPVFWEVFPDTKMVLAALTSHGWRHLILSNHVPELPQLVNELSLAEHFDRIYTSAAIGFEKPHPSAFATIINDLPPDRTIVMIGDNFTADYQGAISAGLNAILVRKTHPDCPTCLPDLNALLEHLGEY